MKTEKRSERLREKEKEGDREAIKILLENKKQLWNSKNLQDIPIHSHSFGVKKTIMYL